MSASWEPPSHTGSQRESAIRDPSNGSATRDDQGDYRSLFRVLN
jgi:hypothetical protein